MIRSKWAWIATCGALAQLLGCAAIDEDGAAPTSGVAQPAAAELAPIEPPSASPSAAAPVSTGESSAAPAPDALDTVVQRAGDRLFKDALRVLGDERRDLIIDPFIDANTGQQTLSSHVVGGQLARSVGERFRHWTVRPFDRKALAAAPLLLIGTLTPVALGDAAGGAPDAYRLWLTLVDLRSGLIVAKRLDRALLVGVNAEPLPFFRDSPTWHKDRTTQAYVNSCQVEARVGERIDALYLWRLPAAALLHEAIVGFHEKKYTQARRLFVQAGEVADPDDLRVLSGRYQTSWRLGANDDAAQELKRLVANGLATKNLPLKVLFQPGSTIMLPGAEVREQYRQWIREVARQASAAQQCLRVVGHASRGNSAPAAIDLSQRRAATVRWLLAQAAPGGRFTAQGAGWRDNLVGLGGDDQSDALDRRIEFRVVDCP
jgi:outer membrane protein OmpA-like peptidoglycan-associated protein